MSNTAERRRSSVFGKLMNVLKGSGSDDSSPAKFPEPAKTQETTNGRQTSANAPAADSYHNVQNPGLKKAYRVAGKTAIVTGAGSGINFCFAKLLLSQGCNVLIADLGLRPEAEALIEEYSGKDESKPRAAFAKTDVTVWSELSAVFHACYAAFGALDIVCPGAGVFEPSWSNFWHPPGSAESKDPPDSNHYKLLDINVTHPIRTAQIAIAEYLNPSKGEKVSVNNVKHVVFISSIAAQTFGLPTPLYFASKHAISGFVRSLTSLEMTFGIKCTGVAPGIVKTPLFLDNPDKMKMVEKEEQEWVYPEEVAEAMLKCIESPDVPGGTILEVGSRYTRPVTAFNDPGPMGRPGMTVSNPEVKKKEVLEWLAQDGWGKQGL